MQSAQKTVHTARTARANGCGIACARIEPDAHGSATRSRASLRATPERSQP
jgi:hypothetical protein